MQNNEKWLSIKRKSWSKTKILVRLADKKVPTEKKFQEQGAQ